MSLIEKAQADLDTYREWRGREPEACYVHPETWEAAMKEAEGSGAAVHRDPSSRYGKSLFGFPVITTCDLARGQFFYGLGPAA